MAWDEASDSDRRKCLALPNWNNAMFLEITGIDVEAELLSPKIIKMTVAEIAAELGHDVEIVKD